MLVNREAVIAKALAERRRHVRAQVDVPGRFFVPGDGREGECRIIEMSPAGAQVISDVIPETGSFIVLYIEGFGRFDAEVVRSEWDRFSAQLRCSAMKQDRVAELLGHLETRDTPVRTTLRRHERVAGQGIAHFTRRGGETIACEVIDLSLSGVSLKTASRPPIGETVMIGQMSGRIVRHHETGIAVEFASVSAEKALDNPPRHAPRL
ncbi:MAG: PilZ domain-containing protein [Rhizomicrobium sp.]